MKKICIEWGKKGTHLSNFGNARDLLDWRQKELHISSVLKFNMFLPIEEQLTILILY